MAVKWKPGHNIEVTVGELDKIRQQNDESVVFEAGQYLSLRAILLSSIEFNSGVCGADQLELLDKALNYRTKDDQLSPSILLGALNRAQNNFLGKPIKKLFVRTSLSITGEPPMKWCVIDECRIRLNFKSQKFRDNSHRERLKSLTGIEYPESHLSVLIESFGRSSHEVEERAVDAVDVLRGIWNLYLNSGSLMRISFNRRAPVNQIRIGPMRSLHSGPDKLATSRIWYDPDYFQSAKLYETTKQGKDLREQLVRVRKVLRRSKFCAEARVGLIRYTRALDHANLETAFLLLWSLLEFLTDTEFKSHKHTIRRAAAFYGEHNVVLEVLRHLRVRRNQSVHSAEDHSDSEVLLYQLKNIVETILRFYLSGVVPLTSKEQLGQFLDLPVTDIGLSMHKELVDKAVKFHSTYRS